MKRSSINNPPVFVADLSLLFVAVIWGSTYVIVKQTLAKTPVFSFIFLRYTFAGVLLIFINAHKLKAIDKRLLFDGMILGIVLFLGYSFQTLGLKMTPAPIMAFITGLYVIIVPILSSILLKKMPHQEAMFGVAIAVIGLTFMKLQNGFFFSVGEFFGLSCAFFYAMHIILMDKLSRRNDFSLLAMVQINVVGLLALLLSIFIDPRIVPVDFDYQLISALVITSVFGTAVAFCIQASMQKHTTPTKAAIIYMMEAVSSVFFNYLLLGELLTIRQYVGCTLIFFAMLLTEIWTYLKIKMGE